MARHASGRVLIGASGWTYAPWRGAFYPKDLPQKEELAFASRAFPALEINGTFYGLQQPDVFRRWYDATPQDFVFAVKGPRYITHNLRLQRAEAPLGNFFASGILHLREKLGPILWQLPPTFRFDAERIDSFLKLLPMTTKAAGALARKHDDRLRTPAYTRVAKDRPLRHAMEIRHDSFIDRDFVRLLVRHRVALVCADTVQWPRLMNLTADFAYCRLHGSRELYRSRYRPSELAEWAERIDAWRNARKQVEGDFAPGATGRSRRRDVYVFFDNTDKKHAPKDAQALEKLLQDAEISRRR